MFSHDSQRNPYLSGGEEVNEITIPSLLEPAPSPPLLERITLGAGFVRYLERYCANGAPSSDTLASYQHHILSYFEWCNANGVQPETATEDTVIEYRKYLQDANYSHATVSMKLTAVRKIYAYAVHLGRLSANPAKDVSPANSRKPPEEKIKFFSPGEAEYLLRSIPYDGSIRGLRDRAMIALMLLEGLRRVEIVRANVEDLEKTIDGRERILVHGKGSDDYIYPRADTMNAIYEYLATRKKHSPTLPDPDGTPIFLRMEKGDKLGRRRISRRGVSEVVDSYLRALNLKEEGKSCHALRHTSGAMIYQATKDVKAVQENHRHKKLQTASIYSHVAGTEKKRHSEKISIGLPTKKK